MTRHSKYFALLAILTLGAVCFTSCEDEDNEEKMGNWVETGVNFPGTSRGGAVCFVIDNKAYIGTGANTKNTEDRERFVDFFYCTANTPAGTNGTVKWSAVGEVAPMPKVNREGQNTARNGAVAFSLNGKGYVGTGYNGKTYLKDFWEYDPEANTWTQIDDYPGDTCRYAVAFVIPAQYNKYGKDMAYVGSGEDFLSEKKSHFFAFDGKTWEPITAIGQPRAQAQAFVAEGYNREGQIQQYGYVAGGNNGGSVDWFQRYNAMTDEWENLNRLGDHTAYDFDDDYLGLPLYGGVSFVVNSPNAEGQRAYIATGSTKGGAGTACWEYNPYYDYWLQKTSFEGPARKFAVSFVLKFPNPYGEGELDIPFVATGANGDITVTGAGGDFYTDSFYFRPYEPFEPRD